MPTGKSYFIIYALLRRMAAGQRTLFSTAHGTTYLFDEQGAWQMEKKNISVNHIPIADSDGSLWSLIDAADDTPLRNQPVACSLAFAVVATSPEVRRYNWWYKKGAGRIRHVIAEPWSVEELYQLCVHRNLFLHVSADIRLG